MPLGSEPNGFRPLEERVHDFAGNLVPDCRARTVPIVPMLSEVDYRVAMAAAGVAMTTMESVI